MKRTMLAITLVALSGTAAAEYTFDVSNNTDQKITAIEVSEDGNSWGEFNIGAGIKAGTTSTLAWDASTDDSSCEWTFRATFADGSVSEEVDFDFCEEGLTLEFN